MTQRSDWARMARPLVAAKAGAQLAIRLGISLDSRFRGNERS